MAGTVGLQSHASTPVWPLDGVLNLLSNLVGEIFFFFFVGDVTFFSVLCHLYESGEGRSILILAGVFFLGSCLWMLLFSGLVFFKTRLNPILVQQLA